MFGKRGVVICQSLHQEKESKLNQEDWERRCMGRGRSWGRSGPADGGGIRTLTSLKTFFRIYKGGRGRKGGGDGK